MIDFNEGCKIALKYFYERFGEKSLSSALDGDNFWIFYSGKKGEIKVGGSGLIVFKETGDCEDFILPNPQNLKLLNKTTQINLPECYLRN